MHAEQAHASQFFQCQIVVHVLVFNGLFMIMDYS